MRLPWGMMNVSNVITTGEATTQYLNGIFPNLETHQIKTSRIPDDVFKRINLEYGDMLDMPSLLKVLQKSNPDEIYNLAAMSHVHVSFEIPEYTANTDGLGTLRMLEAIRLLGLTEKTKIYT